MTRIPRFRPQILVGFLTLQAGVLVASLAVVGRFQERRADEEIRRRLQAAGEALQSDLGRQSTRLGESLRLLGSDYALKRAFAIVRDTATLESVAVTFRSRIGSDLLWVTDASGRLQADASRRLRPGAPLRALPLVDAALQGRDAAYLTVLDGELYQASAAPLESPMLIGVLVAGFRIDDAFTAGLKRLGQADISFAAGGTVLASTLDPEDLRALAAERGLSPGRIRLIGPPGRRQLVLPLEFPDGAIAYVQRSWDAAIAPTRRLQRFLVFVGLAGFALTALFGYGIAGKVESSIRGLLERLNAANAELADSNRALEKSNEELAKLNGFQNKFFHMVAHDARNPLTAIRGYGELLAENLRGSAHERNTEKLLAAEKMLDGLIGDLVDFASIQVGKLRIQPREIELAEVIEGARGTLELAARKRGIDFSIETPPELPRIQGDPLRLTQVIQNLCTNALHYTPRGGRVVLSAERGPGEIRVLVRDTGIGISQEDLCKIFQRFFQAKDAQQMRGGGFGLGLKIAREIVQAHGGDIRVESRSGQGSVFSFNLPI